MGRGAFLELLWMGVSRAHLRVGVPIWNTFIGGCGWVLLFKAHLWVGVPI